MAAVQLLPTAEYLLQSQRASALDFEFALNYSTWPWHFLNLLAPDLFGNPAHGDYWGYANYWEDAMYIGLLPFLLALSVALRQAGRILRSYFQKINPVHATSTTGFVAGTENSSSGRHFEGQDQLLSKLSLFLLSLIAVTVVLALGKNTPVFPWLYAIVPTFDMFQAPARYLIWLEFALVLLAAIGLDQWRRPTGRALYWTRLATAGAIAVSVGAALAWYLMGDIRPTFIQATALAGVWGVTAGGLSLLAPPAVIGQDPGKKDPHQGVDQLHAPRPKTYLWGYVVVVFVAVDLIVAGWGLNPGEKLDLYDGGQDVSTPNLLKLAEGGRVYLPEAEQQVLKFERFFQFDTFKPQQNWRDLKTVLLPNMNLLYGIASVNNFDPMVPGRFASWMEALEAAENPSKEWMMNLMGVSVVERVSKGAPAGVSFESRSEEGRARARWVPCAVFAQDGEDALNQTLLSSSESRVVIEGKTPENQQDCSAVPGGTVQVISETPNQLVIQASAPTHGWLLVSDVWYPGWSVRVDQRATSIWRADYLFRAVELPQGDHQIVFSYQPASFWVGLVISVSAIMGMVVIFVLKIGRFSSD
ncbi:MAG: YfhO family protein [Anaerolineales bacterium]